MPWGRVDDGHYRHPKVLELDEEHRKGCLALYWLAISWCNDHLTDGRVPVGTVRLLGADVVEAEELVRVGMWEKDGRGYRVHDFLDFNKSKEQVLIERVQRTEAGRLGAAARWPRSGTSPSGSPSTSSSTSPSGVPSELPDEPIGESDAPYPVPRTPYSVTPFPAPTFARDGLPNIDDEARTFLEGITGRTLAMAGDKQLAEYDRQLGDHGKAAVFRAYRKVMKGLPGTARPHARQVVWPVMKVLEPFADPKVAEKAEREAEEQVAHRARLEKTRRLIDQKPA